MCVYYVLCPCYSFILLDQLEWFKEKWAYVSDSLKDGLGGAVLA